MELGQLSVALSSVSLSTFIEKSDEPYQRALTAFEGHRRELQAIDELFPENEEAESEPAEAKTKGKAKTNAKSQKTKGKSQGAADKAPSQPKDSEIIEVDAMDIDEVHPPSDKLAKDSDSEEKLVVKGPKIRSQDKEIQEKKDKAKSQPRNEGKVVKGKVQPISQRLPRRRARPAEKPRAVRSHKGNSPRSAKSKGDDEAEIYYDVEVLESEDAVVALVAEPTILPTQTKVPSSLLSLLSLSITFLTLHLFLEKRKDKRNCQRKEAGDSQGLPLPLPFSDLCNTFVFRE